MNNLAGWILIKTRCKSSCILEPTLEVKNAKALSAIQKSVYYNVMRTHYNIDSIQVKLKLLVAEDSLGATSMQMELSFSCNEKSCNYYNICLLKSQHQEV